MKPHKVLLGVTGSIAAYKAAELARELTRHDVQVRVMMTPSATRFISPLTFEALVGSTVVTDLFQGGTAGAIPHISLAAAADTIVIAPASADTIARIAHGLASDIVSCTAMAFSGPLIVAPAMHENMFLNVATQTNIEILRARGVLVVGPESGDLASGGRGAGRMSDVDTILGWTLKTLGQDGDLAKRTVVVTAGGTQEPIDPVRCVTNRSSGRMGYALAEACRDRGAQVILVTAPTSLRAPSGIEVVPVMTARQMYEATQLAVQRADVLVMAAAVADYRPAHPADDKIKKERATLEVALERTVDILGSLEGPAIRVGFAAESSNLEVNARAKLSSKRLDLIVANDITSTDSGFGVDNNRVTIMGSDGATDRLPLLSKREVADRVLDRVVQLLA